MKINILFAIVALLLFSLTDIGLAQPPAPPPRITITMGDPVLPACAETAGAKDEDLRILREEVARLQRLIKIKNEALDLAMKKLMQPPASRQEEPEFTGETYSDSRLGIVTVKQSGDEMRVAVGTLMQGPADRIFAGSVINKAVLKDGRVLYILQLSKLTVKKH